MSVDNKREEMFNVPLSSDSDAGLTFWSFSLDLIKILHICYTLSIIILLCDYV